MHDLAESEQAPSLTEWHAARVLVDSWRDGFVQLGMLAPELLVQRVGEELGRTEPTEEDKARTWCFCDTNVFLHYRFFNEVEWHTELGVERVVLVVPAAMLRELDKFKADPSDKPRNKRARQVLPRLERLALNGPAGTPSCLRQGVEILPLGREPASFPAGLDPSIPDDRLIAAALEFRWRHPGTRVVVLSGDLGVRRTAREFGLEQLVVPEQLRLPSTETV